ncbi:MAG: UpxY family transcription antiterminator [Prevotella sp.]|nr:UpxY family transcription antiterminator [Prevotella sp.]
MNTPSATEHPEWFPMRVTYHRELKMKQFLDELGIENFIPMHYEIINTKGGRKRMLVPAIHNLIFVRTTQ